MRASFLTLEYHLSTFNNLKDAYTFLWLDTHCAEQSNQNISEIAQNNEVEEQQREINYATVCVRKTELLQKILFIICFDSWEVCLWENYIGFHFSSNEWTFKFTQFENDSYVRFLIRYMWIDGVEHHSKIVSWICRFHACNIKSSTWLFFYWVVVVCRNLKRQPRIKWNWKQKFGKLNKTPYIFFSDWIHIRLCNIKNNWTRKQQSWSALLHRLLAIFAILFFSFSHMLLILENFTYELQI